MTHPRIALLATLCIVGAAASTAPAFAEVRIAVSLPLSGDFEVLGHEALAGARAAARTLGDDVVLVEIDDGCTAEGGIAAAERMKAEGARIGIGFLCTEPLEAAAEALRPDGIPLVTIGVRTDSVTANRVRNGWSVFRLSPSGAQEVEAVGALISEQWRTVPFAIVDDGTLHSRELAEGLRFAAGERGLTPVVTDTFRPQMENQVALVRRLGSAGATHVFVAGDAADAAVIGRDAREAGIELTIAGGDSFRGALPDPPLPQGTLMVALPDWAAMPAAAEAANAIRSTGRRPEGYAVPAYAAVQLAANAVAKAATVGQPPRDALADAREDTAMGPVAFDAQGDLSSNPFILFRFDGDVFVPLADAD